MPPDPPSGLNRQTSSIKVPIPNPARIRSYLFRLPLFTRIILFVILGLWILELQTVWSVIDWGALVPDKVSFGSMYRLNTYPLVHMGFFHMLLDTICLIPLMERFESEWGTLNCLALWLGPLSTIPAGVYIVIEKFVLRGNTAVLGSSVWVFLLLGVEAIKTFRANPYLEIASVKIPTWVTPLALIVVTSVLIPNTSFLGHLCAVTVGYLFEIGYLKFLAPPEKISRWIEAKLNLLGRLPHYVSVDQKTYGRYGVLPQSEGGGPSSHSSSLSNLRTSPQLLKIPPYISLLCFLGGILWLLFLPLDEYSRRTYISENALLPGQVHTYFHGTEQNIFRAYRHEIADVLEVQEHIQQDGSTAYMKATPQHRNQRIRDLFANSGIKSAVQPYKYKVGGQDYEGENVYGIVHAPRGDGTESIVIVAPVENFEGQLNTNGVTLLLTLARYFSRWSLWSKDIILLVTPDTSTGPQAWIDAYLSQHDPGMVSSLSLKSGAIQGVICVDFPFRHSFHALHISYDGINGQLPNLDLINTAAQISTGQLGIPTLLQSQHLYAKPEEQHHYLNRLKVLGHGMRNQAVGHSTGAHSVFMPYHIDAITLTAVGHGREDEMAFGRVVESLTRSINNLLEKLHQSFFFYLLLQNNRFVSIGTYLPSAMAVGAGFTVMAIYLWIKSGYEQREEKDQQHTKATEHDDGKRDRTEMALADPNMSTKQLLSTESAGGPDLVRRKVWKSIDRPLIVPLALLSGLYLTSLVPLAILITAQNDTQLRRTGSLCIGLVMIPIGIAFGLANNPSLMDGTFFDGISSEKQEDGAPRETGLVFSDLSPPADPKTRISQFHMIVKSLSLLVLGLELTVLATLNFSLSMFLGVLCAPLCYAGYYKHSAPRAMASLIAVVLFNPFVITNAAILAAKLTGYYDGNMGMNDVLKVWLEQISFSWMVSGSYGVPVGVFCVWLPAWTVATIGTVSSFGMDDERKVEKRVEKVKAVAQDNLLQVKQAAQRRSSPSPARKRKK
ncbi:Glycosyl phosphatidyl inositol protein transamidase complex subunit [Knufia fluminis]|uniref:Glycosyl phosphatidyl inositol protein transamidase complex subunit n=1 Tax=Knufia fluminis TaxID=191047 RepID=A0AAN8EKT8_9EURO|nr:Glycosyl phosphatidyl inositol protein transamidase complex subunit [Knufia fluminis]